MPADNVQLTLRMLDTFNRRDADAFVATLSPDVEWEDAGFWSDAGRIYRGHVELREWFEQILEPWSDFHLEAEEVTEAPGGGVFAQLHITARGQVSGAETKLRFWGIAWLRDGAVTRRRVFLDKAEALEAAGLPD